jgi:predicted DNA-binding protein
MQVALNSKVSLETAQALEDYSKQTGKSKASIIEAALKEYLEKEEK